MKELVHGCIHEGREQGTAALTLSSMNLLFDVIYFHLYCWGKTSIMSRSVVKESITFGSNGKLSQVFKA